MVVSRARETVIGAVTLGVLVLLLWTNAADRDEVGEGEAGYRLNAIFQRTEGLSPGADVRVAGMSVGQVVGQTLDERFRAHVTLRVDSGIAIPADSAAIIETDGLLGSKYIEIQPGGAEEMLAAGQRIDYTQGSVVIEELLAKIVEQAKAKRAAAAAAGPSPADDAGTDGVDGAVDADGLDDGAGADGAGAATPFPSLLAPLTGEGERQ